MQSGINQKQKIQHLYNRAGFGMSPDQWRKKQGYSIQQAVDDIFKESSNIHPLSQIDLAFLRLDYQQKGKKRSDFLKGSAAKLWQKGMEQINQMAGTKAGGLRERMTLFWHGHFASSMRFAHTAVVQNNMLREHALGNFRDLVMGICRDPGMLYFLNAGSNRKNNVNENFGRELLELFTIGEGNYTQKDVFEASRAFTGWNHNEHATFDFVEKQHDFSEKAFLGQKGEFDGTDIIDILLEKKQTARFITTKIYAYFVNEEVNTSRVNSLADSFYQSNYDISKLMRTIFESSWFYDPENIGTKIKSPLELLIGIMKVLGIQFTEPRPLYIMERTLGQIIFEPPSVAGWPSGRQWINNSNILLRMSLARYFLPFLPINERVASHFSLESTAANIPPIKGVAKPKPLCKSFSSYRRSNIGNELAEYLLSCPLGNNTFPRVGLFKKEDLIHYYTLWLMGTPEYQVC